MSHDEGSWLNAGTRRLSFAAGHRARTTGSRACHVQTDWPQGR